MGNIFHNYINVKINSIYIRLGQIFKIHLGQEFLYYFSENWLPRRFLGVESIFEMIHCEKCPVFLLSKLFQDGRHQIKTSQVWTSHLMILVQNHCYSIKCLRIFVKERYFIVLITSCTFTEVRKGGHYPEKWKCP